MKQINSGNKLTKIIKVTTNYKNDLKKAEAKGYTFSDTLHSLINLNRGIGW